TKESFESAAENRYTAAPLRAAGTAAAGSPTCALALSLAGSLLQAKTRPIRAIAPSQREGIMRGIVPRRPPAYKRRAEAARSRAAGEPGIGNLERSLVFLAHQLAL